MNLNFFTIGCIFIALRMTNRIDWPMEWVLSPFWIELVMYSFTRFFDVILFSLTKPLLYSKLPQEVRDLMKKVEDPKA